MGSRRAFPVCLIGLVVSGCAGSTAKAPPGGSTSDPSVRYENVDLYSEGRGKTEDYLVGRCTIIGRQRVACEKRTDLRLIFDPEARELRVTDGDNRREFADTTIPYQAITTVTYNRMYFESGRFPVEKHWLIIGHEDIPNNGSGDLVLRLHQDYDQILATAETHLGIEVESAAEDLVLETPPWWDIVEGILKNFRPTWP